MNRRLPFDADRRARTHVALIVPVMLLVLTGGTPALAETESHPGTTTIVLVRHAEKRVDGRDPDLSEAGRERARELRRILADAAPAALYATQYARTRQTLEPLASAGGLVVVIDRVEGGDIRGWAAGAASRITRDHAGKTVVVAGHSNTVPLLIEALGVSPAPQIGEADYDDLFVVTQDAAGQARLLHLHYGARSTGRSLDAP